MCGRAHVRQSACAAERMCGLFALASLDLQPAPAAEGHSFVALAERVRFRRRRRYPLRARFARSLHSPLPSQKDTPSLRSLRLWPDATRFDAGYTFGLFFGLASLARTLRHRGADAVLPVHGGHGAVHELPSPHGEWHVRDDTEESVVRRVHVDLAAGCAR
jgi:hypothetical protein